MLWVLPTYKLGYRQILNQLMKIFCRSAWSSYSSSKLSRLPFKKLQSQDIDFFKGFVKPQHIITDPHEISPYNLSWFKTEEGKSELVLTPDSAQQISQIMTYCNKNNLAVVPQGGNTGLVGGSVPAFDEVILSTKNINRFLKFDQVSSVLTLEAGVILEKANEYVNDYGCEFPLDLGAKGTCQVGGNAATAAGGIYLIKHGSFRSHILGMEVVLPDGRIMDMQSQIHKDNTGYDLKQLFIGSEGTLGVITKLNVHCPPKDHHKTILAFKAKKYEDILEAIPVVKKQLGNKLTALEYVDGSTYNISSKHLGIDLMPVSSGEHLLFVETTSEDIQGLLEVVPEFPEAVMSNNDQQFKKIWRVRESIATIATKEGKVFAYDISYEIGSWNHLMNHLRQKYPGTIVLGYGHIGDGNIHINICSKDDTVVDDQEIFRIVTEKKGSISAEHGVGIQKPHHLHIQKSPQILYLYRQMKNIFDPNGIMNPYKMVP